MKKLKISMIAIALAACMSVVACTSSQVQTITQLIGIAVNAIPGIVTLLGANPAAQNAAAQAKSDFALAQTVIADYGANSADAVTDTAKLQVVLADAQTNLSQIVAAIPASDANKTKIDGVSSILIGVAQDIIAALPSSTSAATVAHVKLPKPSVIQSQINAILAK